LVRRMLEEKVKTTYPYRIEVGKDHSGDRALWIIFAVPPKDANSSAAAKKLRLLGERVQRAALDMPIHRWPYIRFEAA